MHHDFLCSGAPSHAAFHLCPSVCHRAATFLAWVAQLIWQCSLLCDAYWVTLHNTTCGLFQVQITPGLIWHLVILLSVLTSWQVACSLKNTDVLDIFPASHHHQHRHQQQYSYILNTVISVIGCHALIFFLSLYSVVSLFSCRCCTYLSLFLLNAVLGLWYSILTFSFFTPAERLISYLPLRLV